VKYDILSLSNKYNVKGLKYMTFGEKIAKLRKEINYTQEQLADILNVSRQSVSKWESNTSYPETDKLICLARLFKCSTDYLLKDECVNKNGVTSTSNATAKSGLFTTQKIIGYILLPVSLIAGILIFLLAESEEVLFVLLPVVLSILVCSLICLFVEQKAGYWCVWAVFAPITLLTPFIVGLSFLNGLNFVILCFYAIMFFVAEKLFIDKEILTNSKKNRFVIICWVVLISLRIFSYISIKTTVISSAVGFLPYSLLNLLMYIGVAVLMTYTICYINNLKQNKH